MRPSLSRVLFIAACALSSVGIGLGSSARADGEIHLRGNYWRDRNTRVLAPEATLRKDYATGTTVEAGYLLDAITSASASAGVAADQPFTELRNEVSARVSQRLGLATLGGVYRYSTESDYWAHTAGINFGLDLFQRNLSLGASYVFGHAEAAQRAGAANYLWAALSRKHADSILDTHFVILTASQVLSRWALIEGSYELGVLDGFQGNPYRNVRVSGTATREVVPDFRVRHTLTAGLRLTPLYRRGPLHHLGLYVKYRYYTDSWGLGAHAPEVRAYGSAGPVELRLTARYYTQSAADFYRSKVDTVAPDGTPTQSDVAQYDTGVAYPHCPIETGNLCYTGDSKLGASKNVFLEARLELALGFLDRPSVPFGRFLGGSRVAASAGYYKNDITGSYQAGGTTTSTPFSWAQYGNAWVGALEITLPL